MSAESDPVISGEDVASEVTQRAVYPVPDDAGELTVRAAVGALVAVVAVLIVQASVVALGVDVGGTGDPDPFAAGPLVGATVAGAAGAAVVYAGAVALTDRPVVTFAVVAALGFAASLVPVVAVAPGMGVTVTGVTVLLLYHFLVASSLVGVVSGAVDLPV